MSEQPVCPCGSGQKYHQCCEIYHSGSSFPATAESLMRSRFTAFAMGKSDYVLDTWDSTTRPKSVDFSKQSADWLGLEIVSVKKGGRNDNKGIVQFKAFYREDGIEHSMNEISRFRKVRGHWFYLDGTIKPIAKVGQQTAYGRNSPCPCGSGRKFKRCCGAG